MKCGFEVFDEGIVIFVNDLQPVKTIIPKTLTEEGTSIGFNALHCLNAEFKNFCYRRRNVHSWYFWQKCIKVTSFYFLNYDIGQF